VIGYSKPRHKSSRGVQYKLNNAVPPDNAGSPGKTVDRSDLPHALQRAYRLLTLRAHSAHEIEKKLRERGFPTTVIKEALEKLHDLKYLDDGSFAFQWTRNLAANKLWGNRKIFASLQEKGIAAHLIGKAIEDVRQEISEEEAVSLLIKKKITGKKINLQDVKDKKRILQNLLAKGFPAGLILIKLGKIPEEDSHGEDGQ
jgi:regulatory protein